VGGFRVFTHNRNTAHMKFRGDHFEAKVSASFLRIHEDRVGDVESCDGPGADRGSCAVVGSGTESHHARAFGQQRQISLVCVTVHSIELQPKGMIRFAEIFDVHSGVLQSTPFEARTDREVKRAKHSALPQAIQVTARNAIEILDGRASVALIGQMPQSVLFGVLLSEEDRDLIAGGELGLQTVTGFLLAERNRH